MKRYSLLLLAIMMGLVANAQSHIRVWQAGEDDHMKIANVGDMTFSGSTITFNDSTYNISDIDSIIIVPEITVTYNGTTATVNIPEAVAEYVTAEVSGADVTITNTDTSNEMEFVLSGTSTNGSLTYIGSYKCSFYLNGLNLTSTSGCPFDIKCGKRIAMSLVDGTDNYLTDGTTTDHKATLNCKGHLEIKDGGTLTVTGNYKHAIRTKEYLQLKKSAGTITIASAVSDAIHCGQYFQMNGGTINIDENTGSDGIQVETIMMEDDTTQVDTSKEYNGKIFIKGGTINETIANEDCKGIKCDSLITITGGTINITASGNGSRGIQTDSNMTISEDDNTTTITIAATGGLCTAEEDADDPHRCMGMKIDYTLTVNAGTITVTNTGTKSRGIRCGTYVKNGGTVSAKITTG